MGEERRGDATPITLIKENAVFSPLLWGEVGALAPGEGLGCLR